MEQRPENPPDINFILLTHDLAERGFVAHKKSPEGEVTFTTARGGFVAVVEEIFNVRPEIIYDGTSVTYRDVKPHDVAGCYSIAMVTMSVQDFLATKIDEVCGSLSPQPPKSDWLKFLMPGHESPKPTM